MRGAQSEEEEMKDEDFQELLDAIDQIEEYRQGLRHDLRRTVLPAPPEPMDAAAIRALRERVGASQAIFAFVLNVSPKTVQAWEAGARIPAGGNLKLLRVAEAHPEAVFAGLELPPPLSARAETAPNAPCRAA
jgi:putative transcriptional regulator